MATLAHSASSTPCSHDILCTAMPESALVCSFASSIAHVLPAGAELMLTELLLPDISWLR